MGLPPRVRFSRSITTKVHRSGRGLAAASSVQSFNHDEGSQAGKEGLPPRVSSKSFNHDEDSQVGKEGLPPPWCARTTAIGQGFTVWKEDLPPRVGSKSLNHKVHRLGGRAGPSN